MITHIAKTHSSLDEPLTVFVMECGASCVIDDMGQTTPPGFDFYSRPWTFRANCPECHIALADRVQSAKLAETT